MERFEVSHSANMKILKENLDDYVDNSMNCQLTYKLHQYDEVQRKFQTFFNAEELSAVIDRKADIELINRLHDVKANQTEIDDFNNNLTDINDKL